ncbi:phosphopyruvate hydratase [Candidatus Micrarchaeota archaeon]|nr:phosphopyruvate hydratase [Candidatus Micrarchaeota archaeon]
MMGREILDSRGNPTVEVEIIAGNVFGIASAPSGASTGTHEALELRDGGREFLGKGVLKAVENVNNIIAPALIGMDASDPRAVDLKMRELDGTKDKSRLGANAMVATSMAVWRTAAGVAGQNLYEYLGGRLLPKAMFNIINGGKHAGNKLSIQEFMIIPDAARFADRLRMASEIYHILGNSLAKKYGPAARNVGDEGGYAPQVENTKEALDAITAAIEEAGYADSCDLAIDAAASSFHKQGVYSLDGKAVKEGDLIDFYEGLVGTYGRLVSIEDPFDEEDFGAFAALKKRIGNRVQIVGDDLLVTNISRIRTAIEHDSVSALLLKVNQIGTVSEALEAVEFCRKNGLNIVVSHRSGETEDSFIADLAVGINAGQIKSGAPARGERTAKYNQLLRIEERVSIEM